jgi:hypothetical protein
VQNFIKLLQEGKVWETEADVEPGEKATGVGSTSKANTDAEPGGKTAGFGSTGKANPGPAGKVAGAELLDTTRRARRPLIGFPRFTGNGL